MSVHGANRLGTNSLLDIVVFGRRGGAAHGPVRAGGRRCPSSPTAPDGATRSRLLDGMLTRPEGENAADIRKELQEQMFDLAFVVRTRGRACGRCRRSWAASASATSASAVQDKGSVYNTDLMEAVELGFLLDCADTLVTAALARDESRGRRTTARITPCATTPTG